MASVHSSVLSIALLLSFLVLVTPGSGARFNYQISRVNEDIGCYSYVGVLECKDTVDCEGPCDAANYGPPQSCITHPRDMKNMVCCCYEKQ